jgi:hypothetical protein
LLVCLDETQNSGHWLAKVALISVIMLAMSLVVQAKFSPFARLPAITTDEERANTLADYYQNPTARIVVVGSSLTYRLKQSYFDLEGVRNIALAGTSALTGMRIVASQTVLPKVLLVETNVLVWPVDDRLVEQFSRSAFNMTPLRIRPVRTLVASVYGMTPEARDTMYRERIPALLGQPPAKPIPLPSARPENQGSPAIRELDLQLMRRNANAIVALALELQARGTQVFLFQVPAAQEIFNHPQMQNTRRILREELGAHSDLQMELAIDESKLRWIDGAHLDERSAILVVRAMENWLSSHNLAKRQEDRTPAAAHASRAFRRERGLDDFAAGLDFPLEHVPVLLQRGDFHRAGGQGRDDLTCPG